jgi:hypothetical protein
VSASSPPSVPVHRLDTSALTEPVVEQSLTRFVADSKASGAPWSKMTTGIPRPSVTDLIGQFIPVVIPLVAIGFFAYVGGFSLLGAIWEFTLTGPFPLNLVIVGIVVLVLLGVLLGTLRIVRLIRSLIIPTSWWTAAFRLTRFAAANGLRYGHDDVVSHPGVIFGTGTDRVAERRLTTTAGRRVEIANYRYTIPAEEKENSRVFGWGYVAISLDRRLPHLLLDAKANNNRVFGIKTSNLPIDLAPDQRLSLGGEFDDKFTLYAPSEYGRDAFYVFTPDLMALFIDRLGTYDVEIVDDTMFVYGSRFDLLNPRTYDWLTELVDTVVARTLRRTERYTDDFAALEADPAQRRPVGATGPVPAPPAGQGSDAFFSLLPGLAPSGAGASPREASPTQAAPSASTSDQPVFAFGGDGPPRAATNTIAAQGRRLRRRRWGLWTVIAILIAAFWVYNDLVAPIFGLPRLDDH